MVPDLFFPGRLGRSIDQGKDNRHEATTQRGRMESHRIQHETGQSSRLVENVEGYAVEERVQDLRRWNGWAAGRHG